MLLVQILSILLSLHPGSPLWWLLSNGNRPVPEHFFILHAFAARSGSRYFISEIGLPILAK